MSNIRATVNVQPLYIYNISHSLVYVGEDPREEWNNEQIRYELIGHTDTLYKTYTSDASNFRILFYCTFLPSLLAHALFENPR
jgi:hypothetical protein